VSVEAGAVPTGFAGFTSSRGALLFVAGDDFGSGPRSVSGVGVGEGAGLTRRGLVWASAVGVATQPAAAQMAAKRIKVRTEFRYFIGVILSDLHQFFQTQTVSLRLNSQAKGLRYSGKRTEAVFRMPATKGRFAAAESAIGGNSHGYGRI